MSKSCAFKLMRDKTAMNLWIVVALLAAVGVGAVSISPAMTSGLGRVTKLLAGAVILLGASRILALARLMYHAGQVPLAGKWTLFACLTAAVAVLWIIEPSMPSQ
jgi:hypothetical protein